MGVIKGTVFRFFNAWCDDQSVNVLTIFEGILFYNKVWDTVFKHDVLQTVAATECFFTDSLDRLRNNNACYTGRKAYQSVLCLIIQGSAIWFEIYLLPASTRIDFKALQPEKMLLPDHDVFSNVQSDAGNVIVFKALQLLKALFLIVVTFEGICMSESCSHPLNRL